MPDDGLTDSLSERLTALLEDSLNNSAAEFVETERYNILLDGWHYGAHAGRMCCMTHLDDDLLHDVIAVEVERAILNLVSLDQLLHEFFLLGVGKHLKTSLKHSTSMLVSWKMVDISSEMGEDNIKVLTVYPSNLLYLLNDVVTKRILNQLVKSYGRIFQQIV